VKKTKNISKEESEKLLSERFGECEAYDVINEKIGQTKFGSEGNCMSACLATLLECHIEDIPCLHGHKNWRKALNDWMIPNHGFYLISVIANDDLFERTQGSLVIVAGESMRGVNHAVIYKNGELWHDPHPEKTGIKDAEEMDLLVQYYKGATND